MGRAVSGCGRNALIDYFLSGLEKYWTESYKLAGKVEEIAGVKYFYLPENEGVRWIYVLVKEKPVWLGRIKKISKEGYVWQTLGQFRSDCNSWVAACKSRGTAARLMYERL